MSPKLFRKYLDRDGGCVHCGELDAVAPHHRRNRGMGGSKILDRPSNIIVLCSVLNGLLESDSKWAARAVEYGWKLRAGSQPDETAVFYPTLSCWVMLDDLFHVKPIESDTKVF
jgi:hypothetical protein